LKRTGGLIDRPFGEHQVEMRLIDVVLGEGAVDGESIGKAIPQELPRRLSRELFALCLAKLTGQSNLQLRVGAAIGAFMGVGSHPERMRISLGELRHIAGFDQRNAATLFVFAIARDVTTLQRQFRSRSVSAGVQSSHA
jgi:hypothetical protein